MKFNHFYFIILYYQKMSISLGLEFDNSSAETTEEPSCLNEQGQPCTEEEAKRQQEEEYA